MNYFAHGLRFVDRPYFLAGTAIPDWLSAADRRVRLRPRRVEPFADGSKGIIPEVAAGILQHFHDDRWFHKSPDFIETSEELAGMFRRALGGDRYRTGFLGHIVTELLLDAVLIESNPNRLDDYYAVLADIDAVSVQAAANHMAKENTTRLAFFIHLFRQEQFLRDYLQPQRLLYRLNQVMQRIKLNPLPDEAKSILQAAQTVVKARSPGMLAGWQAAQAL